MHSRRHLHIALCLFGLLGLSMLAGCSKSGEDQSSASSTPAVKDKGGAKPSSGTNASAPQAPTFDSSK